ncbi:MAG: FxsA family protein [Rhodospirillales bacterium]|nr:FxsA family protein [Rhodospirillales bacterium]
MIGVPIIEIAVFIEVGGWLGLVPTLAIVVLTAVIGTGLLRHQGFSTLARAQQHLAQGRFPMAEVFDGLCLLLAGALLLTPGFVTDAFGFLLFVPGFRAAFRGLVGRYLESSGRVNVQMGGFGQGPTPNRDPSVIEGEFEELGDAEKPPSPDNENPWQK